MRTPPSDIETILHFYYSPERHPRADAPAVRNAIVGFVHDGMLIPATEHEGMTPENGIYKTTERGKAWVEMICTTPYPEQVWRNPVTKEVCSEF